MKRMSRIICHVILCPLASLLAILSLVATQAFTGYESHLGLMLFYTAGWALFYGMAAGLPGLLFGAGVKASCRCFGAFAFAGGLCGLFFAMMYLADSVGGSPASALAWFAMPLVVPWLLGSLFATLLRPQR